MEKGYLKLNNLYCKYFLKKNGSILYLPTQKYNQYICLLKKIINITYIQFPDLTGRDEDTIINKLLLLAYVQKHNIKYYKINEISIYIFHNDNEKDLMDILFLSHITKIDEKMNRYFNGNLLKKLTTLFMFLKITTNKISDRNILIRIFYEYYIHSDKLKDELLKKYNITIQDFANFNKLYIFLKKYGYVDTYYNVYTPKILKNYKTFYKKLISNKKRIKFHLKIVKKIKKFSDINLLEIADSYLNNKFNKKYIKNKFIELSKKYNL